MTLLLAPPDLCFSDCKDIKINLFANPWNELITIKLQIKIFNLRMIKIHIIYICHIGLSGRKSDLLCKITLYV